MSKNLRKLKCITECVEPSKTEYPGGINPITLDYFINYDNSKSGCLSNFLNISNLQTCNKDNKITKEEANNIFKSPNPSIDLDILLSVYDITNIDSLIRYIDIYNEQTEFNTINRILNMWIKNNQSDLKKFNKVLFKIIKQITDHHLDLVEIQVNKELGNYIDYWINDKKNDDFYFDLIHDFKKFLSKKYGSK